MNRSPKSFHIFDNADFVRIREKDFKLEIWRQEQEQMNTIDHFGSWQQMRATKYLLICQNSESAAREEIETCRLVAIVYACVEFNGMQSVLFSVDDAFYYSRILAAHSRPRDRDRGRKYRGWPRCSGCPELPHSVQRTHYPCSIFNFRHHFKVATLTPFVQRFD